MARWEISTRQNRGYVENWTATAESNGIVVTAEGYFADEAVDAVKAKIKASAPGQLAPIIWDDEKEETA